MRIEERLSHLKADIEELQMNVERSKVAFQTGHKYMQILEDINLDSNVEVLSKTSKEGMSNFLEYLRDRIEVVRKVSPRTAERLESKVKLHEKLANSILEEMKKAKNMQKLDKKLSQKDFQMKILDMISNSLVVQEAVETCYNCLIDTLQNLEREN